MSRARGGFREVNLEAGRPYVDQAIRRLTYEINNSKTMGYTVIKIIHGYGSSGTGGKIRISVRRYLDQLMKQKKIKLYETGEEFSIFSERTRTILNSCPSLRKDRDLERHNNGVTFVLL
ncbi:MAG: Smr/MutS family protein [Eubacteriales bacterium]